MIVIIIVHLLYLGCMVFADEAAEGYDQEGGKGGQDDEIDLPEVEDDDYICKYDKMNGDEKFEPELAGGIILRLGSIN